MSDQLNELLDLYPLSKRWKQPEPYYEQVIVKGIKLETVGIAAYDEKGQMATGSAAEVRNIPIDRSYFELIERTSYLDFVQELPGSCLVLDEKGNEQEHLASSVVFPLSPQPTQWNYARSNGLAVHKTYSQACNRARMELIERNAMLCSWYGGNQSIC